MRKLVVDERSVLEEDAIRQFPINSPPGGWLPALRNLHCTILTYNLPFIDLLFSPHLERVSIFAPQWNNSRVPRDVLPILASTISGLPVSTLQSLWVRCTMPSADLEDAISSVVLRCGPSLAVLTSSFPLSDAAVNHLIQLPHLRTWSVNDPPPGYSVLSFPLVFPPLTEFTLGEGTAQGWLSLFQRLEDRVPATQGVTPLSRVKESLKCLNVNGPTAPIIDTSSTRPIQMFQNLVRLSVRAHCYGGQCAFRLDNGDVTELAMALPQLENLLLGSPCPKNTCVTTAACLLPISVYCAQLDAVETHFSTTNILGDLKNTSVDPQFRELRSLPRCMLRRLYTHAMPLTLDESDFQAVVDGMKYLPVHMEYRRVHWHLA